MERLRFIEVENILYTKHANIKKNGLEHIRKILEKMGDPQKKIGRVIHITGTNGKGSVAYLLSGFLNSLGFKVGLFTSPHIRSLTERIKINGVDIDEESFVRLYDYVTSFDDNLSFFEIMTLVMIKYFQERCVDFSVVEVGIGGLYDTTNVVDGELCYITSVDYDHMDMLGLTLDEIAFQKGGIIKEGSVCIAGDVPQKQIEIIKDISAKKNATFIKAQDIFHIEGLDEKFNMIIINKKDGAKFKMPLVGLKQTLNLSMVIEGLSMLGFNVDYDLIERSLSSVKLEGRFQIIEKDLNVGRRIFILDGAHNLGAIRGFIENIRFFGFDAKKPSLVFSMLSTKDYKNSIRHLSETGIFKRVVVTSLNNPKKLSPYLIADHFSGEDVTVIDDLKNAIYYALKDNEVVCVLGSFYLVSDAIKVLEEL